MNTLTEQKLIEVENQYWVDLWASLERLHENKDFQRVILEGYFRDKAINGVSLLAQDSIVRNGQRTAVMESLIAISQLEDYFITIRNLGSTPSDDVEVED